jgi:hypothetical protein
MNYPNFSYTHLDSLGSSRYLVYTQVFMSLFSKRTLHNIKNENLVTLAFTTTWRAFTGERLRIWLSSPSSINLVFSNVIQDIYVVHIGSYKATKPFIDIYIPSILIYKA